MIKAAQNLAAQLFVIGIIALINWQNFAHAQICEERQIAAWDSQAVSEKLILMTIVDTAKEANPALNITIELPNVVEFTKQRSVSAPPNLIPWAGYFMPSNKGGAVARRNGSDGCPKDGKEWVLAEVVKQCLHTAVCDKQLSPIEKYVLLADKQFDETLARQLIKHECDERGSGYGKNRGAVKGDGYCNGVRAASLLYPEPANNTTRKFTFGGKEINITITPYDIKALIAAGSMKLRKISYIPYDMYKYDLNPIEFDIAIFKLFKEGIPLVLDGRGDRECKKMANGRCRCGTKTF